MNITVQELLALNNPNIIDIRPTFNYNNNHIPGAKNIQYNQLVINPSKYLDKNKDYYIYCKRGYTSLGLCKLLISQGYRVHNILGGYESWVLNKR